MTRTAMTKEVNRTARRMAIALVLSTLAVVTLLTVTEHWVLHVIILLIASSDLLMTSVVTYKLSKTMTSGLPMGKFKQKEENVKLTFLFMQTGILVISGVLWFTIPEYMAIRIYLIGSTVNYIIVRSRFKIMKSLIMC